MNYKMIFIFAFIATLTSLRIEAYPVVGDQAISRVLLIRKAL